MSNERKETPDLLPPNLPSMGQLLKGEKEQSTKSKKEKSPKVQSSNDPEKQRLSSYVDVSLILDLEAAQNRVKRITGLKGHSVSRSALVEAALKMALNDLEAHGENSVFISLLK